MGLLIFQSFIGKTLKAFEKESYELQVDPNHQGKGIGRKLLMEMESIGQSHAMTKSMLTVFKANDSAIQFYKKMG
jgi:ribosomal protein S18 acetylase RimI-like enzyme